MSDRVENAFIKFAGVAKVKGIAGTLENRIRKQNDLDRILKNEKNRVKFKKDKCKMLHWGWNNYCMNITWRTNRWEAVL